MCVVWWGSTRGWTKKLGRKLINPSIIMANAMNIPHRAIYYNGFQPNAMNITNATRKQSLKWCLKYGGITTSLGSDKLDV